MSEWEMIRLGDLGDVVTGKTPSTKIHEYFTGDIPFITPADFGRQKFISTTERHLSKEGASVTNCIIPKNTICVTCIGSDMGKIALTSNSSVTNQQINSIITDDCSYDANFVYYAVLNICDKIKIAGKHSTAVPIVNKTTFSNFAIACPSLPTQKAIAAVLSSLDDKIQNNNRHIDILEDIIGAVFCKWFCDEDVRTSWSVGKFSDFLKYTSERIGEINAPVYSTTNNGVYLRDEKFNKTLSKSNAKNKKVVKDDLMFGLSREILNFGIMRAEIGSVSPVYEIFKIDQNVFLPIILEMEIRTNMHRYMDILKLGAREGQAINRDYLLSKDIYIPPMPLQERFMKIYSVLFSKINNIQKEKITIAETRDMLLPKLMSGEMEVPTKGIV